MAKFKVTATCTMEFDTDVHPWVEDARDAEGYMAEYINEHQYYADEFDITVEETE